MGCYESITGFCGLVFKIVPFLATFSFLECVGESFSFVCCYEHVWRWIRCGSTGVTRVLLVSCTMQGWICSSHLGSGDRCAFILSLLTEKVIGVIASNVILLGDEEADEEGWSRPWKPRLIKNLHFSCVLEVREKGLIILSSTQIMSKPSRNGQKDYAFVEASKD